MTNKLIGVGSYFPSFSMEAVIAPDKFQTMTEKDCAGSWTVFFTWPLDFTFVCPTEVKSFNELAPEFAKLKCKVFGMSIDSVYAHNQWIENMSLDLKIPLLADVKRDLSSELGILDHNVGATYRATYIIDPSLVIRSLSVNDLSVGRNSKETLRLVQAFQTGKLCGCEWQPGDKTLN